jgi:hypothetical protein
VATLTSWRGEGVGVVSEDEVSVGVELGELLLELPHAATPNMMSNMNMICTIARLDIGTLLYIQNDGRVLE